MSPSEASIQRRAEIAAVIAETCNRRRDSDEHRKACINETLLEPEADWPWWLDYWRRANPKTWDLAAVLAGKHP